MAEARITIGVQEGLYSIFVQQAISLHLHRQQAVHDCKTIIAILLEGLKEVAKMS